MNMNYEQIYEFMMVVLQASCLL